MQSPHHHHDQHDQHAAVGHDDSAMAELLDLDAEVLHSYLSEVTAWISDLGSDPPLRILDVGSGTGTGTFALLERFALAEAVALDLSAPMLDHLREKARSLGVADRIHTIEADLNTACPAIDTVDLAWAASSLHHMYDPDRVLSEIFALLRPGGLLVVAEMDSFPRFLPDDLGLGRPGLEARVHAVLAERHATDVPNLGADWGTHLSEAGYSLDAGRSFAIELTPPLPASAVQYARVSLRRLRSHLRGRMSADDLATLETLVECDGPDGIGQRDDLTVRTTRTVWAARRPSDS